jgi:hypothetical protein
MAAEIQGVQVSVPRQPRGLSEEDLKASAAGLGIEAEQVDAAIRRHDEQERTEEPFYIGGTTSTFTLQRAFCGEIEDSAWHEMVQEGRGALGVQGLVTSDATAREWSVKDGMVGMQLRLEAGEGHTVLCLITERRGQLFLIWACSVVAVLLGAALFGKGLLLLKLRTPLMILFSGLLVVLLLITVRALIASWAKRDRRKLAELLAKLEALTEMPAGVPAESAAKVT